MTLVGIDMLVYGGLSDGHAFDDLHSYNVGSKVWSLVDCTEPTLVAAPPHC